MSVKARLDTIIPLVTPGTHKAMHRSSSLMFLRPCFYFPQLPVPWGPSGPWDPPDLWKNVAIVQFFPIALISLWPCAHSFLTCPCLCLASARLQVAPAASASCTQAMQLHHATRHGQAQGGDPKNATPSCKEGKKGRGSSYGCLCCPTIQSANARNAYVLLKKC